MDINQKKAILTAITEEIAKELLLPCSVELENVGSVFFISGAPFIELKKLEKVVHFIFSKYNLKIEIVDLNAHQFVGSADHAKALFESFYGGRCWHDQIFKFKPWISIDVWRSSIYDHDVWEEPTFDEQKAALSATPLDKDDVLTALL